MSLAPALDQNTEQEGDRRATWFLGAAETYEYRQVGGIKQQRFILSRFWRLEI